MRAIINAVLILSILSVAEAADATSPTTAPVQTGEFNVTFTQRSPLSEYSKLLDRLGTTKDEAGPDYDLKDQPFVVYVPPDYDGSTPFGLMVQSFQDGSPEIFKPEYPVLNAHHLIVIATKNNHLPLATNLGVCLDAVFNMQQRYAIDPSRIYLMGLSKPIMPIGMCTGDVFTGDVYIWWFTFYAPWNGMIESSPIKYKPSAASLRLVQSHMQVVEFNPEQKQDMTSVPGTLRQDGFDHVFGATMSEKDFLEPVWFEQVIKELESVRVSSPKPHETVASTQPSPEDPQRLLGLAQAFIRSNRPDLARAKLQLLISKYPDSAAGQKARELLDQLNGQ
jgi:hypothetical protein